MKKFNLIFRCAFDRIKKKFFKDENNDINHACVELQNLENELNATNEEKEREEYAQNYNLTTRWQTI
ncbi:hypothetical protein [Draconibacterium halophilum]|uniref:Uncharacterized protein n=1 Tax=Draconibacterium halophilum TaxID=2706887 RepID=A0A6C0RDP0_9BACT|nr:hypothetical protein [Draconibacterium halophilum]QIA08450.1 hypothetical protein G0Q07_12330 [Draconibacterium halophilum]